LSRLLPILQRSCTLHAGGQHSAFRSYLLIERQCAWLRTAWARSEARDRIKLVKNWSTFPNAEQSQCVATVTKDRSPSYVELVVCLEMMPDSARAPGRREGEKDTKRNRPALSRVGYTFCNKEARLWNIGVFKSRLMSRVPEDGGPLSAVRIGPRFAWAAHVSLSSLHRSN
jgi:hypothetical protein